MIRSTVVCALLVTLLQGCAVVPFEPMLALEVPEHWLARSGNVALHQAWWSSFGDPVLAGMVEKSLSSNLDLKLATARLDEARALVAVQDAASYPALDLGLGGERSRAVSDVALKPYFATGYKAQFMASYEVDLWGRVSALQRSAAADSDAFIAARDAVALSVVASVAGAYVSLLALDAQLRLAHMTLGSREKSLQLTQTRERSGYGSSLESAQAEAELRATAQTIPQLELGIQRQERALNVLLAERPQAIARGAALRQLVVAGPLDAGVPSTLLRRRPDIASAERRVAAADEQLAASRAQLLPSVRLTGALGGVGSTVLSGDPFSVWSIGGSALAPMFNGGRLRSLVNASVSRRDQALLTYQRTVLTAFAEVENQLADFSGEKARLVQLEAQAAALQETVRIVGRRYTAGYASYLDLLLAERSLFAVQQTVLQVHAELLHAEIGLFRALGGGWKVEDSQLARDTHR